MMGKKTKNIINSELSDRIRSVMLEDVRNNFSFIKSVLEEGKFGENRKKVSLIAHTYKGNAEFFNLDNLGLIAKTLDKGFENEESDSVLIRLTEDLRDILELILIDNE